MSNTGYVITMIRIKSITSFQSLFYDKQTAHLLLTCSFSIQHLCYDMTNIFAFVLFEWPDYDIFLCINDMLGFMKHSTKYRASENNRIMILGN